MADLDDMEMLKCPHCGKEAPEDFFPLCSCAQNQKKGKKPAAKTGKGKKPSKSQGPYEYDF